MKTPKLSIITVNLNNAEGLRKTIESVVNQIFTDYECIVCNRRLHDRMQSVPNFTLKNIIKKK